MSNCMLYLSLLSLRKLMTTELRYTLESHISLLCIIIKTDLSPTYINLKEKKKGSKMNEQFQ